MNQLYSTNKQEAEMGSKSLLNLGVFIDVLCILLILALIISVPVLKSLQVADGELALAVTGMVMVVGALLGYLVRKHPLPAEN